MANMSLFTILYIGIFRHLLRTSYTTRRNIQLIASAKIRLAFGLPLPGEDETLDQALHSLIIAFFDFNSYKCGKFDSSADPQFVCWLLESGTCNDLRRSYFILHFWSTPSEADKLALSETFQSLYGAETKPLSHSDVWALYVETRVELKSSWRLLRETKAQKLDFRLNELALLIPWISSVLVCSGYIYISTVYGHFQIDPAKFFSIGDYLSSSLEQIDHALFALMGYVLGVIHGYRRQFMFPRFPNKEDTLGVWWPELLTVTAGTVGLLFTYWHWDTISAIRGVHTPLLILLLMTVQSPLIWLTGRYFKNSLSVGIFAITLIIFLGSMFISAKARISDITSDAISSPFVVVSKEKKYTQLDYKIIGANSRYMFFWNRKSGVEVVPLRSIDQMSFLDED